MDIQGFIVTHPYLAAFLNPILSQVVSDLIEVRRVSGSLGNWNARVAAIKYVQAAAGGVFGILAMIGLGTAGGAVAFVAVPLGLVVVRRRSSRP